MKTQVIVVGCYRTKDGWRSTGKRTIDVFDNLAQATIAASKILAGRFKDRGIIIRPLYNEKGFFREWRSFGGMPFQECRFNLH